MSESVYEISAYAKINLFLKILGTLPNGYHKLYTIMQEVDLCDEVTLAIEESPKESILVQDPNGKVLSEDNLCFIAARKFLGYLRKTGSSFGDQKIRITLEKNIPAQSGMGGGSSDAAAVLLVLQEHFGDPFSEEELTDLAVSIGADVPFFLYGGTCLCEMVGEKITVLKPLKGGHIVLMKPGQGVSTAECFRKADSNPTDEKVIEEYKAFVRSLEEGSSEEVDLVRTADFLESRKDCSNDLQTPAEELVPKISALLEELRSSGALSSRMTGSGSAVFGIYEDQESAERAYRALSLAHEEDDTLVYCLNTI